MIIAFAPCKGWHLYFRTTESFFGYSVSTPRGDSKHGLVPLDPTKMQSIFSTTHHHPSFAGLNITDLEGLVKSLRSPITARNCILSIVREPISRILLSAGIVYLIM